MEKSKVSIVIPAYNHEKYVGEAIQSVLNQTFQDFELIIINDGSTDNTEGEILKFKDGRIRYFSQENRGLSATLNRGIELSRGEYFSFLPSDDAFLPEKLAVQLEAFRDSGDIGMVFSYHRVVDGEGNDVSDDPILDWFSVPFETKEEIFPALFERDFLSAPTAVIKKECFDRVGSFDESLKTAQDYDMWMRILKYYDLRLIKRPLIKLRWHGRNLTYQVTPETELERAKVLLKAYKNLTIEDIFPSLRQKKEGLAHAEAYGKLAIYMEKSGIPALIPLSQTYRHRGESLTKSKVNFPDFAEKEDEARFDLGPVTDDYGKVNILIEAPSLDKGGMEEVIYNIATHLDPTLFRIVVVCVWRGGLVESRLRKAGIPVEILGQEKEREYLEILRRYRVDLVNTHYSDFGPPLASRRGIPVISFIHSIYNWVSNKLFDDFRRVDPYVSRYIAVSKDAARFAQYRFNIFPERIQVIPDGIDLKHLSYPKERSVLTRKDLGLDEGDFIFLHVGAISRTKMHNLMIAALKSLPPNFSFIKILCLGQILQEDYHLFIRKKIQEEGLEKRMMLLGFAEDPVPYYQLADAFLLPSLIEGWGLATLEAMYHGLPLILTRVGGAEEVIEGGDIGILINNCCDEITQLDDSSLDYFAQLDFPSNTGELVAAMSDFYARKEYWKEAGKKGKEKVVSRYTLERIIPQYEKEFLRLAIGGKNKKEINLIHIQEMKIEILKEQNDKMKILFRELQDTLSGILNTIGNQVQNERIEILEKIGFLEYQLAYVLRRLSVKERIKDRLEKIKPILNALKAKKLFKKEGTKEGSNKKLSNRSERSQEESSEPVDRTEIPDGVLVGNRYDVFFFPMIDFSFRYQRPQQLASYFAKKGHRVFYMNISQFVPSNAKEEFKIKEIKEHVFEVFLRSEGPLDIYGGEIKPDLLNVLYSSLSSLRKKWGLITTVSLVHNPFWTPLVFRMKEEHHWKIIYDCVDEWETFSHIGEYSLKQEAQLVRKADLVTVTAELLYKKWQGKNNTCTLIRNACDYEHFLKASSNSLLSDIKKPIIGFLGGIADWVDIDLIKDAASRKKEWSFVMLGGVFTDVSPLEKLPNVHLLGNKPYPLMPDYLYHFDVCLIPFKKNKITEAVDPVKLYEYFSSGKPVVARDLYEIRQYKEYLYLFNTKEEFIECIEKALYKKDSQLQERRKEIAASNTWEERINRFDDKIRDRFGKASIIIVTFNNHRYTELCIESIISKTDYPNFEIIIIDNHSTDGTRDYLRGIESKFDFIRVILNEENLGFAKANNQGTDLCDGNYIVFLNNDTVVTKGWLSKFVYYLDRHPEVGLIGPVTNFCGNEAKIETSYKNLDEMDQFAYSYMLDHEGKSFDISMLAFHCVAMGREMVEKVGLLDENFTIGMFEDDDYSYRVKLKGYRVVCAEDIYIHHFGQAAFKKLINTGEYQKVWDKNKRLFEEKWGIKWNPHKQRQENRISIKYSKALSRTKEHWGDQAGTWRVGRGIYWLEHEEVQRRINEKVSGNPDRNPCQYLMEFMTKRGYKFPVERCLTLGCGAGDLEREISKYNFCLVHDALDISEKAVEKAIKKAERENLTHINYRVEDINKIHLSPNTYDVVFGFGSFHHFENLEEIFCEVNKALKIDGIFFLNEYIGPNRFQWTDRQLEVINSILKILPQKYKAVVTDPSKMKHVYKRPAVSEVMDVDPSEAIRSSEILPLLGKYFNVLETKEIGGGVLHSLLTSIAGNFKTDKESDKKLLEAIFTLEDVLTAEGEIASDFAVIIAKKRIQ